MSGGDREGESERMIGMGADGIQEPNIQHGERADTEYGAVYSPDERFESVGAVGA